MSDSDCAENSYLPETSFEPSLAAITSFLSLNSTVDRSSAFMSLSLQQFLEWQELLLS
ncbi:hypothetical protein J7890_03655 [Mycoplasmopsis agalactiae]|uniref:hypothetical protein n=1 Tax=Mycoplasmopsis agalactiae TaxID=2110 RepID=UPI001F2BDC6D|nr:hypothetical protein [Mycoplasmopsis agalactiae]MCE6079205.1 hypothetical protein [Mycoplasmopsis agalactiae]